jgi:hypothetical protein
VHIGLWWEALKESDHIEDVGEDGRTILKCIFKKWNEKTWTGSAFLIF